MKHESGWPDEPSGYEVMPDGRREPLWSPMDLPGKFDEFLVPGVLETGPSPLKLREIQGLHDYGITDDRIAFIMGITKEE